MKLSECVIEYAMTGILEIDVAKAIKCWGKTTFISRWHDEYRLVNMRASVKIGISKGQAQELISKLNLVEIPTGIFTHGSTYRKSH